MKSWLIDNLGEASRSPRITVDKRQLVPIKSCNKGGVIAAIYTDPNTKEYYATIGNAKLGFFPASLSWDALITQVATAAAATAGK